MSRPRTGALDWLRERRDKAGRALLSDDEFAAGDRLRRDFVRAGLMPRVTMSWSSAGGQLGRRRLPPDHEATFGQHTLAAQERVRKAIAAVQPEYANLLIDVCCLEHKLSDVERRSGWPQRAGKVVLQMALRQLARHYGMVVDKPTAGDGAHAIRHWASDGYRPPLERPAGDCKATASD